TKARVRIWTLADFLEAPGEVLRIVQDDIAGPTGHGLVAPPRMRDLAGLREFLQDLRNDGMLPHVVGDLSRVPDVARANPLPRAMN
nr:glycosyl transferase [Paracoccaceae bacterium]